MMKQLSLWIVVALIGIVAIAAWQMRSWINARTDQTPILEETIPKTQTAGFPWFVDATKKAGITFRHYNAATPKNTVPETFGSGLAWIDYDNDGWLDLFFVQDGPLHPRQTNQPLPTNKLYRNRGDGTFVDVTKQVGLARAGFHMGCAVGDYDNDGFDDLVVTYLGGVVLYHNEPDDKDGRRFVNVTDSVGGLANPHTATSCGWGDIDNDGYLDLYVCNYGEVDWADYPRCEETIDGKTVAVVCSPHWFKPVAHKLFRNQAGKRFVDVSTSAGIATVDHAPGLAVLLCDLDKDERLDIYVANDLHPSYLFHNMGNGKFIEKAVVQGCGLDNQGTSLAGMGIVAGDVDGSGELSLFVTNFQKLPNILFRNQGNLFFRDTASHSGLGPPSKSFLAFGTVFFDADLDGHLDVAIANGHIDRHAPKLFHTPYEQTDQLFLGKGNGHFRDVSTKAGRYFHKAFVSRGMARGDFNNDGWVDLAISTNNGGPAILLQNATKNDNHWLVLQLQGDGKKSNRNAVGARVEVQVGKRSTTHAVCGGGSYLSANSRRLHIGLGTARQASRITVIWPSGLRQSFRDVPGRRFLRITEGKPSLEKLLAH